ncbi:MAG: glycosyltransferase family 4 protein [Nanoarchaeota archaeon]
MNKKLRIAIFEPSRLFPPGGKNMDGIAKHLSKKHDVTVFTQKLIEGGAVFNTSKIKFIKPKSRFLAPFAFLKKNIDEKDFDLVILGCFPATLSALKNFNNIPSIYISHAPPRFFYDLKEHNLKNANFQGKIIIHLKNILFKKLDYLAIQKITKILGVSSEVQRRIKLYYNRDSIVYPAGVNPEKFKTGRYDNYILSVCRLVSAKRPEIIVKSMEFVKNKNIKLIMVGSGDLKEKIKELAENYSNVEVRGFVSDDELKELYANCLATIYIPINEDLGYAPQEAGVSGKATIGADEGGLKETIIDGETGFLIDNPTPEKIAEKIDFFANNKDIAEKMGKNAAEHTKKFHLENTFKILDNVIKEVIK